MSPPVPWTGLFVVAIGATLGAWLRWGLAAALNPRIPYWPLGTLVANLVGGFLVGVALAWLELRHDLPREWRLLIVTGFLGALTTFSTFSAEVVALLMRGHLVHAGGLAMLHLAGSLALTALGIGCVRALAG
jgi:CrcB protein